MQNKNIILTIGIPVYNGEKSIADLLNSITVPESLNGKIEILVSDNCSTDSTAEIVKGFSEVKYFKNLENIGYDRNMHNIFEKASGDFVWTIGADDVVIGALDKLCSLINDYPDLALICVAGNSGLSNDFRVYDKDELFLEGSEFRSGFVSANIIKRSAWLNTDTSKYFGSGWIHFGVVVEIANRFTTIVMKTKFVDENPKFSNEAKNWDLNGSSLGIMLKLVKIFKEMPSLGYSRTATRKAIMLIKGQYPKNIIKAKANGLIVDRKLFNDFVFCYSSFPSFWLVDVPSLLLPKFISKRIYNLRKIK